MSEISLPNPYRPPQDQNPQPKVPPKKVAH